MPIAINIETNLWKSVIELLIKAGWAVMYKYDNFDAGIDFDFLILGKDGEEILFGWDNWVEGEIKCSEDRMKNIEQMMGREFEKGDPVNLKPAVILLYRNGGR